MVVCDGLVADIRKWITIHPGGSKILERVIGTDITNGKLTGMGYAVYISIPFFLFFLINIIVRLLTHPYRLLRHAQVGLDKRKGKRRSLGK